MCVKAFTNMHTSLQASIRRPMRVGRRQSGRVRAEGTGEEPWHREYDQRRSLGCPVICENNIARWEVAWIPWKANL